MQSHLKTRRSILVSAGAIVASTGLSQALPRAAGAQQARKRRNVEALSQAELEAYELAIQIVKDRSTANPADKTGYLYWANLHDDFDTTHSGCAHFSEKFLPWHRRHLFDFEAVLRQTKPGVTDNLMIPYWDWTKPRDAFPQAVRARGVAAVRQALFDQSTPLGRH